MKARSVALGGVTAALAVVVMCLGGIVPLSTYICPMVCCVLLQLIRKPLGQSMSWVWYAAVSLLCLLLGPDKEAAAVFLFFGYYPIIKSKIDQKPAKTLRKLLLFNISALLMYALLIHLFGMAALAEEFSQMGIGLLALTLLLGNVCFFLLDRLLDILKQRR